VSLAGNAVVGLCGIKLIDLLYDPRYAMAGPMIVLMSLVFVPRIVFVGAGSMLLVRGDSRRNVILTGTIAITQTALLMLGAWQFGIVGAILAPGVAILVTSPLRMKYARLYEAWDAKGEFAFLAAGLAAGVAICWLYADRIATLFH
jgi:O-antigen/teichoic acid export membrane protein